MEKQMHNRIPQERVRWTQSERQLVGLVDVILESCAAIASDVRRIERCSAGEASPATRELLERVAAALATVQPSAEVHAAELDADRRGFELIS